MVGREFAFGEGEEREEVSRLWWYRTTPLFASICLYLASQAYGPPIAPLGPSWAVWPGASDLAVLCVIGSIAFLGSQLTSLFPTLPNRWLVRSFGVVVAYCTASFFIQTILIGGDNDDAAKGIIFGGFSMYRMVQFFIVVWGAALLPMNAFRKRCLYWIGLVSLVIVCVSICLTYFSAASPALFVPQLPHSRVSGAWLNYMDAAGEGLGTIGYNHGYVAAQVLVLAAVVIHLSKPGLFGTVFAILAILLSVIACFFTGSRMGLISMLLFAGILLDRIPRSLRVGGLLVGILILGAFAAAIPWGELSEGASNSDTDLYSRQKAIFHAFNRESLSGRDDIWKEHLTVLNDQPLRWVVGGGLGAAAEIGGDAHNQVLEIITELGVIGLIIWGRWLVGLIKSLWRYEQNGRVIWWSCICLLVSCVSQETLYPVAAMGHLLGFFVFTCVLAMGGASPQQLPGKDEENAVALSEVNTL